MPNSRSAAGIVNPLVAEATAGECFCTAPDARTMRDSLIAAEQEILADRKIIS